MIFRDEFEFITKDGTNYSIEVDGEVVNEDGYVFNRITFSNIMDELGETITADHEHYDEVYNEILSRDYEVEEHNSNFDYYAADFDSFLREKDEI